MRELQLFGAGDLRWVERPDPVVRAPTDAVVRPLVIARCDGDALPIHRHVSRAMQAGIAAGAIDPIVGHICGRVPFAGPFALGHECVAEVVDVGSDVVGVRPGDRVVVPWSVSCGECASCRRGLTSKCQAARRTPSGERVLSAYGFGSACGPYGGMASDLLLVPFASHMLVPLPPGLDPQRVAAASDNLCDAWRAVVPHLQEWPASRVLVIGGGAASIGLYAAGLAVAHGAHEVHYADISPERLGIAEALGASTHEGRRGANPSSGECDVIVEASSGPRGLRSAIRAAAPGARVTAVGYYVMRTTGVPLMHMYAKDVTLHLGISHPRAILPEVLAWIHRSGFPAERVTTLTAPFADAPTAYAERTTKVVLLNDRAGSA